VSLLSYYNHITIEVCMISSPVFVLCRVIFWFCGSLNIIRCARLKNKSFGQNYCVIIELSVFFCCFLPFTLFFLAFSTDLYLLYAFFN